MSLWRIPNTPKKAAILAITFCFSLTFPLVITTTGCKAVMFWMVARHGTQYPSSRDAFRMKDRLPKLRKTILQNHKERRGCNRNWRSPPRILYHLILFDGHFDMCIGTLCQQDIDGLSNNGSIRIDDDFDEKLTPTGREELLVLARRFRGRFADFFNSQPAFNTQDYHVNTLTTNTVIESWIMRV